MGNNRVYLQESIPNIEDPEPSFENDVPVRHGHIQIEAFLTCYEMKNFNSKLSSQRKGNFTRVFFNCDFALALILYEPTFKLTMSISTEDINFTDVYELGSPG